MPVTRRSSWLVSLTLAGLAVAVLGLGFDAITSIRQADQQIRVATDLAGLRGVIVHLDEVLTMSAAMAAETGDPQWEIRYRHHEPALSKAVNDALALAPDAGTSGMLHATESANAVLVLAEEQVFELARAGRLRDARAMLTSVTYTQNKVTYELGMERFDRELRRLNAARIEARERRGLRDGLGATASLVLLLAISLLVVRRSLARSRQTQAERAAELTQQNRELDARVAERTRALELEVVERNRAVHEATAANRAKSEFLANMSHELRTPLNSVIGFASVLLRNRHGQLHPQDAAYVQRIHDNGAHLLNLINMVLDLAKVESGSLEAEYADLSLGSLVDETLAQLQGHVQGRPVTLVAEYPVHLAALRTDAPKLKQVLINLVGNALKFTEKGSVTVRIVADAAGHATRLDVIDTGIGIPDDRQAAVFEAFQQADNTTARRFGGTGLGLAISTSLITLLGYRLSLISKVGVGSTFSIQLNVQESEEGAGRVLIIAGCESHGALLAEQVRAAGGEAIIAGEGATLNPDGEPTSGLILIGIPVPGMAGIEQVETVRQHAEAQGARAVVVGILDSRQRGAIPAAAELLDYPVIASELTASLWRQMESPPDASREHLATILRQRLRNNAIALLSASGTPTSTTVSPGLNAKSGAGS